MGQCLRIGMTDDRASAFEIEVHPAKNVLYIDLTGRFRAAELEAGLEETLTAVESLRDGFDVIADLDGFRPQSSEATTPFENVQASLVERGMDRVVRVVGDETTEAEEHAFERQSREIGYDGVTVESPAAAARMLARPA